MRVLVWLGDWGTGRSVTPALDISPSWTPLPPPTLPTVHSSSLRQNATTIQSLVSLEHGNDLHQKGQSANDFHIKESKVLRDDHHPLTHSETLLYAVRWGLACSYHSYQSIRCMWF